MAFTHEQLLEFPSEEEALDELIEVLTELGFDPTDWTVGSKQRTILQLGAFIYSKMAERVASIAQQTNVSEATADGLTVLAQSFFDETRLTGQKTRGNFGLDLETGQGPYTFSPFDLRVSDGNVTFTNIEAGTITQAQPRLTMSFEAEEVGTAHNIDDRDWNDYLDLITTVVGLQVNTTVGSGSTWITRPGTDDESDTHLQDRCTTKWSTLATVETIKLRVVNVALQVTGVSHAFVDEESSTLPGGFTVYVAGDLITATTAQVTGVYQRLTGSVMNGASLVTVLPASASIFDSDITVYYKPSFSENQVLTQVSGVLDTLIAASPIGGDTFGTLENIFNTNDIVHGIEDLESVRKVVITPATDIPLFNVTGNGQPAKLTRPTGGYTSLLTFIKTAS